MSQFKRFTLTKYLIIRPYCPQDQGFISQHHAAIRTPRSKQTKMLKTMCNARAKRKKTVSWKLITVNIKAVQWMRSLWWMWKFSPCTLQQIATRWRAITRLKPQANMQPGWEWAAWQPPQRHHSDDDASCAPAIWAFLICRPKVYRRKLQVLWIQPGQNINIRIKHTEYLW